MARWSKSRLGTRRECSHRGHRAGVRALLPRRSDNRPHLRRSARRLGHSGGLDKAEYKILKPLSGDFRVDSQQEAEQPAAGGRRRVLSLCQTITRWRKDRHPLDVP